MKKLFSLVLSLIIIATMNTTVSAATNNGTQNTVIDINAVYSNSVGQGSDVISVNVEWGAMQFTYTKSGVNVWNPETHQYEVKNAGGAWSATGNTVTVTNHSNVAIKSQLTFAALNAYTSVTGSFDKSQLLLNSGVGLTYADADKATAKLTLGGTLAETVTNYAKVGTITVAITKQ